MEFKAAPDLSSDTDHDQLEAMASSSSSSSTPIKEEPVSDTDIDSNEENMRYAP